MTSAAASALFGIVGSVVPGLTAAAKDPCDRPTQQQASCAKRAAAKVTLPAAPTKRPAVRQVRVGGAPPACRIVPGASEPARSDPAWQGKTTGSVLTYSCALDGVNGTRVPVLRWVPPGAPAVRAADLARAILARIDLQAITIGMVPEAGPDRLGAVGVPVWMWVDQPSPHTVGPVSGSDSSGGLSVTLTARVESIAWDMGDGTVVTCAGLDARGTEYVDAYGMSKSPTCGHVYQKQGAPYTITATSRWLVEWTASSGDAGTIPLELVRSTTRNIGELQVLTIK